MEPKTAIWTRCMKCKPAQYDCTCVRLLTPFSRSGLHERLQTILWTEQEQHFIPINHKEHQHYACLIKLYFQPHMLEKLLIMIYCRSHPVGVQGLHVGYNSIFDGGRTIAALAGDVRCESFTCSLLWDGRYTDIIEKRSICGWPLHMFNRVCCTVSICQSWSWKTPWHFLGVLLS